MEESGLSAAGESAVTAVTKPTAEITNIMSNELLKVYELREYCNFIESDLDKCYKKVEMLTSAKNESSKIEAEYKNRNRVNVINSESLLQALNELYKYKSELKSNYIATEKAAKAKKLKYKKIISSYESAWQKSLEDYNADPVFVELSKIQQENALLETEIEKQEKLNTSTKTQFIDVKENLKKTLRENTIAFSKAMLEYKRFLNSRKRNYEKESEAQNSKAKFPFKLFRTVQEFSHLDNNNDVTHISSIDVSFFDDIIVPSENLESQNLEDDAALVDVSKEEALEYLNNYPETIQQENRVSLKSLKENLAEGEDNESRYFRAQTSETAKQPPNENLQSVEQWTRSKENLKKNLNSSGEKLKPVNNTSVVQQEQNGEETAGDLQMECEDSISDLSYEKRAGNQRADESQYHKTSSLSSDDVHPIAENEVPELGSKDERSNLEKNDFKGFTGFFTIGNDHDSSKPSIFKLF